MARVSRKKKSKTDGIRVLSSTWYYTALYLRLSNEEIENGFTAKIKNQEELLLDFISNKPEHQLVDIYCDNGYTGTNFDRPQWQRLMADVRSGKVNCIIVKDLSRLGRNYIEAGEYLEKVFPFLGVRFIALSDQYDSAGPDKGNEEMLLPLKNIINASYAKDLSEKISSARSMQRSRGEFTGSRVPYGYIRDGKQKGKFLIDNENAKNVNLIFDLIANGFSYSEVARKLNQLNIPSPRGGLWGYQSIKVITSNEVYLGKMVQGKSCITDREIVSIDNAHEPIIKKEVFDKVIKQKEKLSFQRSPTKHDHLYLFEGLLIAANSGKRLYRTYYTKKKGNEIVKAYRSPKTYDVNGVPYKLIMIREETLIETVKKVILHYLKLLNVIESFLKQENIIQYHKQRRNRLEKEIHGKKKGLERRKEILAGAYMDMVEGLIDHDEYKKYSTKYHQDIVQIEREILEIEKKAEAYKRNIDLENPFIVWLKDFAQTETVSKELLHMLIEKIIVLDSKEIDIHFTFADEFLNLQEIVKEDNGENKENNSLIS